MLRIFRVSGRSMEPKLKDGDYVVAATKLWRPRVNGLVVARHSQLGVLIKRVDRYSLDGYFLKSDSELGTSTEAIGEVAKENILGTVLFRVPRPTGKK